MTARIKSYKRLIASLSLAAVLTTAVAAPALAAEESDATLGFQVEGGVLTVSTTSPIFGNNATASNDASSIASTVSAVLTVDDLRNATGLGYTVYAESTGLSNTTTNDVAHDIPAGNITVTASGLAGPDAADPNLDLNTTAFTLGSQQPVLTAAAGVGEGTHTADLAFSVALDAKQMPGSYSGTVTLTTTQDV